MEDLIILKEINTAVSNGQPVAMSIITKACGSSPRGEGTIMGVLPDGSIIGTIGGGALENALIEASMKALKDKKDTYFTHSLTENNKDLNMACGGLVEGYIKIIEPKKQLLIVGGGHISKELHYFGARMDYSVVIFEDREDYCLKERFPRAEKLILGDIKENLEKYNIDESCAVVIVTRGHVLDEVALQCVLSSKASYIGMIGSKKKVLSTMESLRNKGYSEDRIKEVYAPIGLDLGGSTPKDIAFAIMAEILLVNNKGSLKHKKSVN